MFRPEYVLRGPYTNPNQASEHTHWLYNHIVRNPALGYCGTRIVTDGDLGDRFTYAVAGGHTDMLTRRGVFEVWRKFAEERGIACVLEYWDGDRVYWHYRLLPDLHENAITYLQAEAHALGNQLRNFVGQDQDRHDRLIRALNYGLNWRGK